MIQCKTSTWPFPPLWRVCKDLIPPSPFPRSVDQMEVIANPQAYLHEKQDIPMATVEHVVFGPKGSFMVTVRTSLLSFHSCT